MASPRRAAAAASPQAAETRGAGFGPPRQVHVTRACPPLTVALNTIRRKKAGLTGDPQEIDRQYKGIKGLVLREEFVRKR